MDKEKRLGIYLWTGVAITMAGVILLFVDLFMPPQGEIHSSVLWAFGELAALAGAVLGVPSGVKLKQYLNNKNREEIKNE